MWLAGEFGDLAPPALVPTRVDQPASLDRITAGTPGRVVAPSPLSISAVLSACGRRSAHTRRRGGEVSPYLPPCAGKRRVPLAPADRPSGSPPSSRPAPRTHGGSTSTTSATP